MRRPPNTQHRASRSGHRKAPRSPKPKSEARTVRHPLFGDIPLVPYMVLDGEGREHQSFRFDPSYAPPLPKGAIRGDITRQEYCSMCHVPRYFFVDLERVCVECRRPFVFRAREQKHWYETLKFHFDATATRCLDCRRSRRSDRAVHQELVDAKAAVRTRPRDPAAQLAVAEAIVRYFQRRKQGPLAEAVAASRQARRLLSGHPAREIRETLFWEGLAHALAGRPARARELFAEFLVPAGGGKRLASLAKEARAWLEAPNVGTSDKSAPSAGR